MGLCHSKVGMKCMLCEEYTMNYHEHAKFCKNKIITCHGCNASFPFDELTHHKKICNFCKEQCEYCHGYYHQGAIDSHMKKCNYKITRCELCNKDVFVWEITIHKCLFT